MSNPFDTAMSRINYRYVRQPDQVTEESLRQFEQEIGLPLPVGYRTFLAKYGLSAGKGDTRFTNPDDGKVETSVDVFYGLKAEDDYDIRAIRSDFADDLPAHLLPIASGSGGHFCLSLAGDDAGAVYWWFPETGPVESEEDVEPIADSFEQFVNSLVRVED
ncbi:MAG TPA: SMI1/KNR4 family protein [Gemmataceae bacterium]|nr:SMI1/KNR4 family protein [Gemmataceae bacterium]